MAGPAGGESIARRRGGLRDGCVSLSRERGPGQERDSLLDIEELAHVWGEIAFCWPGAARISSVFRGALSKQPQIF